MSGLSSDSDKVKQTQEMHCFAGRGLKCSDPILAEMSQNPLDSERGSRDEAGAELRLRLSSQSRTAPRIRCSRASARVSRTTDTGSQARSSRGRDLLHAGDLTMKETRTNRDLCWDRTRRTSATDPEFPHSFSDPTPQGSGASGRAAQGYPTHGRGRSLSWTHRARGPDCEGHGVPGLVHSLGHQGSCGPGPG